MRWDLGNAPRVAILQGMRLVIVLPLLLAACAGAPPHCAPIGALLSPATLRPSQGPAELIGSRKVVLLGETHDSAADHAWQLATIRRLYEADPALVLGFEMFPRAAQPVLDQWVAGQLSEADFLAQSDWRHVWGFPQELYLPIFRFARDHQIPMQALNVSHRLVHLVGQQGWSGVKLADREGVGTPAPASAAYRAELTDIMSGHAGTAMTQARLDHFIDAQLLWDRAMAEAIASQRAKAPQRPMVALMGAGHLENREGVPRQLEALDIRPLVLIPVAEACAPLSPNYADAIAVVGSDVTQDRPSTTPRS
jgi:uncharacterized iron-regulated protein